MDRLRQRADFLAAAAAAKVPTKAFVLQVRRREVCGPVRVGFTVSRKVGTAVERNRVRRRLKQAVARSAAGALQGGHDAGGLLAGHDYVLVGRRAALHLPFERLIEDLAGALRQLDMRGATRENATREDAKRDNATRHNAKRDTRRPTNSPDQTSD
jgi:ribonuclease P protein component